MSSTNPIVPNLIATNPIFVLIDFNNYFTRFYYSNKETCVERYLKFLKETKRKFNPTWLVNLIDSPKNFRYDIYPQYKGNRPPKPEDFEALRENCLLNLRKFHWPIQTSKTLEAEDLANLFTKNKPKQKERELAVAFIPKFIVLSDDKDCLPIESPNALIFNYTGVEGELFKQKSFRNLEMESAEEFTLFLALKGDSCDNVPGVEGIGDVGAKRLCRKYKTYGNIVEKIKNPQQGGFLGLLEEEETKDLDKVREDFDNFLLSYKLIKLFEGEWEYDLERFRL